MVKISWDNFVFPGVSSTTRQQTRQQTGQQGVGKTAETTWANSRVARQSRDAGNNNVLARAGSRLEQSLETKLRDFQTALESFAWPEGNELMGKARLLVPDEKLKGAISGTIPEFYGPDREWVPESERPETGEEQVERYYKYFSRSMNGAAKTDLDPGTYQFRVTQGGTVKLLSVEVESGMTNQDVLEATADAINDSSLPVTAEVINQTAPGTQVDGLNRTGAVLALSVNASEVDQDISLRDRTGHGHLVDNLKLEATQKPIGAAEVTSYALSKSTLAHPGTYTTESFDPEATTTLGEGTYNFTVSMGDTSKDMTVSVAEGDTWHDVLVSMAHSLNSTGLAEAEVAKVEKSSTVLTDQSKYIMTEAEQLEIQAVSPKKGQRLSITGGDNQASGLFSVASSTDNTASVSMDQYLGAENGTPVTVASDGSLPAPLDPLNTYYLYKQGTGIPAAPDGYQGEYYVQFAPTRADAQAGTNLINLADEGTGEMTMDGGNVLSSLGVGSPSPGTDGEMTIDGRSLDRVPGVFQADNGRAVVTQEAPFSDHMPVRVVEAVEHLETALTDIVNAYNELRSFLVTNENMLDQGFAERFREPLEEAASELKWLGLEEWGAKKLITLAADDLYSALGQDPERAEQLLSASKTGLIPQWKGIVTQVLGNSISDYLQSSKTLVEEFLGNDSRTEVELDMKNKLIDLLG